MGPLLVEAEARWLLELWGTPEELRELGEPSHPWVLERVEAFRQEWTEELEREAHDAVETRDERPLEDTHISAPRPGSHLRLVWSAA